MENLDPEVVCKECIEATQVNYSADGSFFRPKISSLHDLHHHKSKLRSGVLVYIAEIFYVIYKTIRNFLQKVVKWLFPRRAKIWGTAKNGTLVGQINYADRDQLDVPIHNLHVEFWGRTYWLQWRKLAQGYSDYDGKFALDFDLRQARSWVFHKLQFEVYQTRHVYYESEKPKAAFERCFMKKVPSSNLTGMRYALDTIHLDLWEYRRDSVIPRTKIKNLDNDSPQYYVEGRVDALYEQIIPIELVKLKHLAQIAEAPETISIQQIQDDYPLNLTTCIEKKLPGYTRGDEWFAKRMMNGMNKGAFLQDKNNPEHYWMKYFGVCNYDHNQEYALPTVEIKYHIKDNDLPKPIEIHLTGPINAFNKDPWQKKVITPASGKDWLYAKRVARVSGSFSTEVDEHFSGTHLNTEQIAIAAYRNFRLSPLASLLFPHVKEVALINHSADSILIHGYIPSATALTEKGLLQRTCDILGMQDWKNWKPMKVINEAHNYANAEKLFWDLIVKFVDLFFEENEKEIKNHWGEVHRFSQDLVSHAVPVFQSDLDWSSLSEEEKKLAEERFEYYAFLYSFDKDAERQTVDGKLRAMSPITHSSNYAEAVPGDYENAKQACAYTIMMATFMHTWINEHQYDDLGEILYSSGGLRFGSKERGILAPESDLSISLDLTRATEMLWFTCFLSRTEYGFITKDEEGDINPMLMKILLDHEEEFTKYGVNIHNIESRTNI